MVLYSVIPDKNGGSPVVQVGLQSILDTNLEFLIRMNCEHKNPADERIKTPIVSEQLQPLKYVLFSEIDNLVSKKINKPIESNSFISGLIFL